VFPCWSHKKESGFGLLVSRRSRQRNSCCGTNRNKKVTKIRPDVPDREASPDAPPDFFLIFFWSSRPEHNQRPPTDTAKRRFALIPTRRKIAVSPLGAQSTPPLAGGRSPLEVNTKLFLPPPCFAVNSTRVWPPPWSGGQLYVYFANSSAKVPTPVGFAQLHAFWLTSTRFGPTPRVWAQLHTFFSPNSTRFPAPTRRHRKHKPPGT